MKSFLISDNTETKLGLRLAGIDGIVVHEREEVLKELGEAMERNDVGIIILTENIFEKVKEEVLQLRLKNASPLIVLIPDRHGLKDKDFITKYIKESVGIKI